MEDGTVRARLHLEPIMFMLGFTLWQRLSDQSRGRSLIAVEMLKLPSP